MKVVAIVLFCVVAAVYAAPVEETNENESVNTLFEPSIETSDGDLSVFNDLVRDKRQYGGKKLIPGIGEKMKISRKLFKKVPCFNY